MRKVKLQSLNMDSFSWMGIKSVKSTTRVFYKIINAIEKIELECKDSQDDIKVCA